MVGVAVAMFCCYDQMVVNIELELLASGELRISQARNSAVIP